MPPVLKSIFIFWTLTPSTYIGTFSFLKNVLNFFEVFFLQILQWFWALFSNIITKWTEMIFSSKQLELKTIWGKPSKLRFYTCSRLHIRHKLVSNFS